MQDINTFKHTKTSALKNAIKVHQVYTLLKLSLNCQAVIMTVTEKIISQFAPYGAPLLNISRMTWL